MTEADRVVLILDNDTKVSEALANLCRSVDLPVRSFHSAQEFLSASHLDVPSCLILDVRFPAGEPSGLQLQRMLAEHGTHIPIIFVSAYGDIPMAVQAIRGGAIDFLTKPVREQDLLDAVQRALEHDRQRREATKVLTSLLRRFELLSAREREIMRFVTSGFLNKQIAAELDLSEVTVKLHRAHVMEKMQAASLVELVRMSDQLSASGLRDTAPEANGHR